MLKRIIRSETFAQAAGWLVASYIRFVFRTSRIIREPADTDKPLWDTHPQIFAMWHGQVLMVPKVKPSGPMDVRIIVAKHGDGDLMANILKRFDMGLLRGSGGGLRKADKGGAAVLRASLKALKGGATVALTADAPPGPRRKSGDGIVTMAKLSGRPVVPCAMATSRFLSFNTWSVFTLNLPFSKLAVVVGKPIWIDRDLDEAETLEARRKIGEGLDEVTKRAYDIVGASHPKLLSDLNSMPENSEPGFHLKTYRFFSDLVRPLAPLFLSYRMKKGKEDPEREGERRGIASRPRPTGSLLWFHAASVGETNAVLPIINAVEKIHPHINILLTTGTVTSARLAGERLPKSAIHQYVPLDCTQFVGRFLDHWQPDLSLFAESEIWPNLILETSKRNVPMILVNGRMSQKSFRQWRRREGLSKPLFSRFDLILAQNDVLAGRFLELGAKQARSVGNLKIDAPAPPVDLKELEKLRQVAAGRPILIAASTHPGEDDMVAEAHCTMRERFPRLLTVIIPRHPERGAAISDDLLKRGLSSCRRSQGALPDEDDDIYIADTIGELGTFYSLSPIAFIGGSVVPHGGQNPVEAVKLGAAVLTGPHWHNFKDAYKELLRVKGCQEVVSADALARVAHDLLQDEDKLKTMTSRAETALNNLSGALDKTLNAMEPYLPRSQELGRVS